MRSAPPDRREIFITLQVRPAPAMFEGRERTHADLCRPVVNEGPVLDFVRRRLVERTEEIGWAPSRDPDLHLGASVRSSRTARRRSCSRRALGTCGKCRADVFALTSGTIRLVPSRFFGSLSPGNNSEKQRVSRPESFLGPRRGQAQSRPQAVSL